MNENGIKEAASKNKRGRPAVFSQDHLAVYKKLFPETKSHRGLVNHAYRSNAIRRLKDKEFLWLVDVDKINQGLKAWKPEILTALGRIKNETVFFEAAAMICREKPRTKDAIKMIHRYREQRETQLAIAYLEMEELQIVSGNTRLPVKDKAPTLLV